LHVDEVFLLVFEELEPSRVGAPDLHVVGFSSVLNIPRLVVKLGSDSQRSLVEPPDLSLSSIWCLDHEISVVNEIEVSVCW
jgi:hypothetical protein